ncbi:MAG TPA: UbiD family decarboxylase [Alphaproteobacteria bacterium]|nr:UbiD family decarboxylase [Alphaproteobacteria bacterium]
MATQKTNRSYDLRAFMEDLRESGDLREIAGADWNLEIGAITEILGEDEGPALLFDEIEGYPKGYRVFSNVLRTHARTAQVLGLDPALSGVALLDAWRKRIKTLDPIPPVTVADGPVFENRIDGEAVDLEAFPAPIWHERDGGRYIGTGSAVVTRDPETGAVNTGTYRCMIQGKDRVSVKMNKGKHGRIAMDKYHAKGEPCPVAIGLGQALPMFMVSQMPLSPDQREYEVAGWLQDAPVEVVESPLHGLPIPATAEIVIEGEVPPLDETELPKEGPFGEWPGYFADTTVGEVPLMHVKAIYHRNDPILLGVPPLKPPNNYVSVPLGAAQLWDQMEAAGIPDITGVWGFVYGGQSGPFTVVSIKQRYAGHAKQAAMAAASARAGAYGGKFVIVVDDDVDISRAEDVIWAVATRCNPRHGLDLIRDVWTSPADPAIAPDDRSPHGYTMDRVLIDACRPYRWRDEFPAVNVFSDDYRAKMREKWGI